MLMAHLILYGALIATTCAVVYRDVRPYGRPMAVGLMLSTGFFLGFVWGALK